MNMTKKLEQEPKNSHRQTLPIELDQKYNTFYQNDEHERVCMTEISLLLIISVIFTHSCSSS